MITGFSIIFSFGDIQFYYFSVDQPWYNGIKWVIIVIITIVKEVCQFSQSIVRQRINDNYNCKP